MSHDKYAQHNGSDKYRTCDAEGNSEHSGKARYFPDGTLKRLDIYSPCSADHNKHVHEWLKCDKDGNYHYAYGIHDNHD